MRGLQVVIYVGPEKDYSPKSLLCHYSPVFCDWLEVKMEDGDEPKKTLPDDNVDDFEVLVEYMLNGNVADIFSVKEAGENAVERCVAFLLYAKKFDLGDMTDIVHDPFKAALSKFCESAFKPEHIGVVFGTTPPGNSLRRLVTQAAISTSVVGVDRHKTYRYLEREAIVEGFAFESLQAIRGWSKFIEFLGMTSEPATERRELGVPRY